MSATKVQDFLTSLPPLADDATQDEQDARLALVSKWSPRTSDPRTIEQWDTLDAILLRINTLLRRDGSVTSDLSTLDRTTDFRDGEVGRRVNAGRYAFYQEADDDDRVVGYLEVVGQG